MAADFSRTLQALRGGPATGRRIATLATMVVLAAWSFWFLRVPVAVYEVAGTARLQVSSLARPVVPQIEGQVVENRARLGFPVTAGELLVQLDDRKPQLALETGRMRLAALASLSESFEREIESEREGERAYGQAAERAQIEQQKHIEKARTNAAYFEQKAQRSSQLLARKAVSQEEHQRERNDADISRLEIDGHEAGLERLKADQNVSRRDRLSDLARLARRRDDTLVQIAEQQARMRELEHLVELCRIRAPASGRLGHVHELPSGSAVSAGQVLAVVVPDETPHAVAWFPAPAAGRLRPGQPARVRLTGFPWTQYGSLAGEVAQVANEEDKGTIRVELSIHGHMDLPIPVQHGLPGTAEVVTEHVPPAVLVLRHIGWWLRTQDATRTVR